MSQQQTADFYSKPILNSPYERPSLHWELDKGQPTHRIMNGRRKADFVTPIPQVKKKGRKVKAPSLLSTLPGTAANIAANISSKEQEYHKTLINDLRTEVDAWRALPRTQWKVTAVTARLLEHWRNPNFQGLRPFFCQVEAAETMIWLTEVAPNLVKGKQILEHLKQSSDEANPGLLRIALKMATGAGKTTVMAMIIAWQTLNAAVSKSPKFTDAFLVVAPGITIRDRLRVLVPSDPGEYYGSRGLVPQDMLPGMARARVVVTNYHAFMLREKLNVSKGTKAALEGRDGKPMQTQETEGEMLRRVMSSLMDRRPMVINDEAHHCYREKRPAGNGAGTASQPDDFAGLSGDDKKQAKAESEQNAEAARVWISGLESVQRLHPEEPLRVVDLSATPFFLAGSGYVEGTIFPWTMSDFSLMDAIECGIVKLARLPVADNIPDAEEPMYRKLWEHIRNDMPKKSRGVADLDPLKLPPPLLTAMQSLYGHYEKTLDAWQKADMPVDPCFVVVCSNTAASKLVFDCISGFWSEGDGGRRFTAGKLPLFWNFDDAGNPLPRPRTLLIDSAQLEQAEDSIDKKFLDVARDEVEIFKAELRRRGGAEAAALAQGKEISAATILREVLNTVGKPGRLGASVRCVVSVSMLSEGWDANNVTHVLGVRAFGTQLLCEQVVGRALRRMSYELNAQGLFEPEYADVMGVPFDFAAERKLAMPTPPKPVMRVHAVRPDRDALEIQFPNVVAYRIQLKTQVLTPTFTKDSEFRLTPELVGATVTRQAGIVGREVDLDLGHLDRYRDSTIIMHLTKELLLSKFREDGADPPLHLFGQLRRIAAEWYRNWLKCEAGTFPAQIFLNQSLLDRACERIRAAVDLTNAGGGGITAVLNSYNRTGSTARVNFATTKKTWKTRADLCHVNLAPLDSPWEGECCRMIEGHPQVRAYVKNDGLGFCVPYLRGSEPHQYIPDFIVLVDDGHGEEDLLHMVVEVKGYRREDAKEKKLTMETKWIPGVNRLQEFGRWAFVELRDPGSMLAAFNAAVKNPFAVAVEKAAEGTEGADNA